MPRYSPTTEDLRFNAAVRVFTNSVYGRDLNQNAGFTGTPEKVHNGLDSTLWTASTIAGSGFTFNSTDHAHEGIITIVDYTALSGKKITIGLDGTDTERVEGVEWTAATSNNATAVSLADTLDDLAGVQSAAVSGAVITVCTINGVDLTKLDSDASSDMTASAQSIKVDASSVNAEIQLDKGSDLTVSDYTAVSMQIYVSGDWSIDDNVTFYGWDTGLGAQVGDAIDLKDYFDITSFGTWQSIVIPLSDMGLTTGTIDAFRSKLTAISGSAPSYYLDQLQVEESGDPIVFTAAPNENTLYYAQAIRIVLGDVLDTRLADGTMFNLAYDKFMGLNRLPHGVLAQVTINDVSMPETLVAVTYAAIGDFLNNGYEILTAIGDGTNTVITLTFNFLEPFVLNSADSDQITLTLSDDLSGLSIFTAALLGSERLL